MALYNGTVVGCRSDVGSHLEHERLIQFGVALVTVAVYRRSVLLV